MSRETKPRSYGYYWAKELHDYPNVLLVFVELSGDVWYGSVRFTQDDFVWYEKFTGIYEGNINEQKTETS